jgi:hypothetical protein
VLVRKEDEKLFGRSSAPALLCCSSALWAVYRIILRGRKYGGMEVSEAQEVKQLWDENARLKKLVAGLSLDKACCSL